MRRVVITGAGTVNPLGQTVAATNQALRAGRSAIGPLDIADLDRLSVKIGAQVTDWEAETHFDRSQLGLLDRHVQFALVAARQARAQAACPAAADQTAVIMGNAGGGLTTSDAAFRAVYAEGKARVHPFTVPRLMGSAAASHISMEMGLTGPAFSVSSACASSNHAIGLAFQMVRSGMVEAAFAGGSEAMLSFGGLKAWEGLRVMSPEACRPFSAGRNGMVQGEGAAVFALEPRDAALARGAPIMAEIIGFSMTSDASDIVLPNPEGAARAMSGALADAGILPAEVDHINAHGTGTTANDRSESEAITRVFGDRRLAITATKSLHGHLIGAAGAVELLAVLLALQEGVIAPTAGYLAADPDCPVDLVTGQARLADVRVALSNAFAFGGLNSVLALRRAD
ncbi:MAG: 3-oxoacyl-[acyl-carrier-protein] synthase [Pseudomonadota bacterium]|jgi:nodulation protein E